jgi:TRAP-type C4-dicarboxylate transport system permease large subunit
MFRFVDIVRTALNMGVAMSFREKLSWVSLGGITVAYGPYFFIVLALQRTPTSLGAADAAGILTAVLVLTCLMTVATIIVAITNVRDAQAPSDERDVRIAGRAVAFAYPVLLAGVFAALATLFFGANQAMLINAILAAVVLGELTRCIFEIVGYRTRG